MRCFIVFLLLISSLNEVHSQENSNTHLIIKDSLLFSKKYSSKERDSILKKLKIRKGDKIATKVFFSIDKEGKTVINKIASPHNIFNSEIIEIFRKMKKFEPAKDSKGNPMSVNYALPITFVIDEFFIKKALN